MTATYFITATDTDAGKTFIATALLNAAARAGYSTAAVKPLAAGTCASDHDNGLRNDDAVQLQASCTMALSYEEINPCCLKQAIAPHIAARQENISLSAKELAASCRTVMARNADLTVIEGAGGWLVPLNAGEFVGDIARLLRVPVILVVGMRLGCLNHALLTVRAMQLDGIALHGWIANRIDPDMPNYQENLDTLMQLIEAPLLATVAWGMKDPGSAFDLDKLLLD